MRSSILLFTAALLFAAPASADVLMDPPPNCPEGTKGEFCHGPPRCAPLPCATDADCQGGAACVEKPLCLQEVSCSGGWIGDGAPPLVPNVTATCDAIGACPLGGTCTPTKVCVGGSSSGSGSGSGAGGDGGSSDSGNDDLVVEGCSCATVGEHAAPWLGLAMFAAGVGIAAARKRRPR